MPVKKTTKIKQINKFKNDILFEYVKKQYLQLKIPIKISIYN